MSRAKGGAAVVEERLLSVGELVGRITAVLGHDGHAESLITRFTERTSVGAVGA